MKPRIWWGRWSNCWVCAPEQVGFSYLVGTGDTPKEAYEDWLRIYNKINGGEE